jgi:S1-C subfamily serine protease
LLPPSPSRIVVPTDADAATGAPSDGAPLMVVAEASTVFILVNAAGRSGSGTGVVVAPGLILTNHHVIDIGPDASIRVMHPALASGQTAQVIAVRGPLESTGGDFALLRIADQTLPVLPFHVSTGSLRLSGVIATGFPGDVLSTDAAFQASLASGRLPPPPGMTVTDGIVNAEQQIQSGARVLVHSAPLSSGNSGGPLIDMCGRMVGVNTFVRRGALRTLNFALSAADAIGFLNAAGIEPASSTTACTPWVLPPSAPRGPAPAPDPEAEANPAAAQPEAD